jgi:3-oxoacyl-[acyl-carrier-protein] synthase II
MSGQLKDSKGRTVAVVTGIGIVTSLGQGKEDNWAAAAAGQSGIRSITRFPTESLSTTIAGTIDYLDPDPGTAPGRANALASASITEAIAQAGAVVSGHASGRGGVARTARDLRLCPERFAGLPCADGPRRP